MGNSKKNVRSSALITGFITVEMLGWIGCLILLLTVVLSRKIQRHATWINLCLAWSLSGISFSLLFIGHKLEDKPNHSLCLTQAALVYASPLLTSSATLALAIHLLFSIHSSLYSMPETERFHRIRSTILVIFPYLTYIAVFFWVIALGIQHPKHVKRLTSGLICGLDGKIPMPGKFSAAFVAATTIVTVSIEGVIITEMWRNWRAYQGENKDALAMIIRVLCFSLCSAISAAVTLVYLRMPTNIAVYRMVPALNPLAFFIIFSTQKDIFDTWIFWKQRPEPSRWQPPVMHLYLGDTDTDSTEKNHPFKPLREFV